jgi:5'-nucleotidase
VSAMRINRRHALAAAASGLALVVSPLALTQGAVADDAPAAKSAAKSAKSVNLDLYAINDFHGQLEKGAIDDRPGRSGSGEVSDDGTEVTAGGAAYLATHLEQLRAQSRAEGRRSLTVAAGDLIGATPLLSAAFHDEPTIEAMNLVGLQISSVGNHEFDEGYRELQRMQDGGCLPDGPDGANNQNSCPDESLPFQGAEFDYLAANVKETATGKTILPPYTIRTVQGQKVGFIGMTLEDTPNIVTQEGVAGLEFTDEVETANALVPVLKRRGVEAIVVLLHEGVAPSPITDIDGCEGVTPDEPGHQIASQLHPEIDLVVSGHSHQPYICTVLDPANQPRLITSGFSVGRVVTEINLSIDGATGDVDRGSVTADNHIITNADGTAANPEMQDLIDRYNVLVQPIADKVLGQIAPAGDRDTLSRAVEANGRDSGLGNLIADSQKLDPTTVPTSGPAAGVEPVVAFMNPGGIRTDLVEDENNNVTFGAAFSVQPFNNYVVSLDLTGQQLLQVLNEQWNGRNENTDITRYNVLQTSGLQYTWDVSSAQQVGADALVGDVLVDADGDPGTAAVPVDGSATYRVVVNSFLAGGGDGFPTLAQGDNVHFGGLDIDSLANHLAANNPYTPPPTDRISSQP